VKTTVGEMTKQVLAFRDARDWKQFHGMKDMALSLVLEAAEVLELTQWKEGKALEASLRRRKGALADELADVLYWLLLIAHDTGVDLPSAFRRKMRKNAAKYPVRLARGSSRKYSNLRRR
jgi:NTP pyrophosphatase (non-canonical NTP hydrolase)